MKSAKRFGLREQFALLLLMLLFSATVSRTIAQVQKGYQKYDVVLFADELEEEEEGLLELIPFLFSGTGLSIRFLSPSEPDVAFSPETASTVLICERWKVFCQLRLGGIIPG